MAQAEEAVGIPDVQKQFWSPGLRRVNSGSTRKLVMLKVSVYFGLVLPGRGSLQRNVRRKKKPDPSRNHCRWTGCMASDPFLA